MFHINIFLENHSGVVVPDDNSLEDFQSSPNGANKDIESWLLILLIGILLIKYLKIII